MAGSIPASLSVDKATGAVATDRPQRPLSLSGEAWRRFRKHRLAVASMIGLLLIIATIGLGPTLWKVPINDIDFSAKLQSPSFAHPFGTDDLGQDVLARLIYGGRISLAVGFAAMFVALIVGVMIGAIAGMASGRIDAALMWMTDLFLSLPQLPLLLLVIYLFRDALKGALGVEMGVFVLIVLVIGGLRWMPVARLVRAQFLSLREKEFVEAARAIGVSNRRIIFRHILPNLAGSIIVVATLAVAGAMLTETALSFLGLGIRPPEVSLGLLINTYQAAFRTRPWLFWFPAASIVLICLCVNFIGDGLRDAFDPKQTRARA